MANAVFFDANGTLMELRESVGALYSRTASTYGAELPAWRIDDAFQRVVARAEPMVFPQLEPAAARERETLWWRSIVRSTFLAADSTLRFDDFDVFFDALYRLFSGAEAWRVREDGLALARGAAAGGLRLGVLSNFDHRLPDVLQALEIDDLFEFIILPFEVGAAKPDPAIFQAAARSVSLAPGECLYVGHDPRLDLAAARAAGFVAIDVGDPDAAATLAGHAPGR